MWRLTIAILLIVTIESWSQGFNEKTVEFGLDYEFTTVEYGGGISFVDFDRDGLDDLTFATDSTSTVRFHRNTGSGFEELSPLIIDISEVKQVLWIDYNNDGELDLYLTSAGQNKLYKNAGDLNLEEITSTSGLDEPVLISYAATWLDYDQDGLLDLVTTYRTEDEQGAVLLYRNQGNDRFENLTNKAGLSGKGNSILAMTSLDYDNDGWTDLFLAQDWEQGNQLLRNNGDGTFTDVSQVTNTDQKMNSMTATIGDYNMDGWMDIYVTNTMDGNLLLRNNAGENFSDVTEEMGVNIRNLTFGSSFFDADNDGDLDLQVVGFRTNFMYENRGPDLQFLRVDDIWGFVSDRDFNNGLALGDHNGDGYLDLVRNSISRAGFISSSHTFWENNFDSNNYLLVDLEGTASNKDAVGSKLSLYINGDRMIRRIAAGESFGSQHSLTQSFGLGENTTADSLVVLWPNGNKSVVTDISANQRLHLVELNIGCKDPLACNFNPGVTSDNGSCRYPTQYMDCTGCLKDADQDGVCDELEVLGCTDPDACNFSLDHTEEDGSCWYLALASINGNATPQPLQLESYRYEGEESSHYNWQITNGSIVLGQGSNDIQVLWHEANNGSLTVRETSEDNCVSAPVTLNIEITPLALGNSPLAAINIYPNPASGTINLGMAATFHKVAEAHLFTVTGRIALSQKVTTGLNQFDIGSLVPGQYILRLITSEEVHNWKVLIR